MPLPTRCAVFISPEARPESVCSTAVSAAMLTPTKVAGKPSAINTLPGRMSTTKLLGIGARENSAAPAASRNMPAASTRRAPRWSSARGTSKMPAGRLSTAMGIIASPAVRAS